ncbi:hypothetical protein ACGFX4_32240 [Kitasatospora sp. NPDC048365]|uniref:hypothetical protein n=1 Tax=Kitasatospora sp. NPDC048365 TaxID=3364050 RepID=UPI00371F0597
MAEQQSQPPAGHSGVPPGIGHSRVVRGAEAVAREALALAGLADGSCRILINGEPGLLAAPGGHPQAVVSLTVRDGRIVEINVMADPSRLRGLPDACALPDARDLLYARDLPGAGALPDRRDLPDGPDLPVEAGIPDGPAGRTGTPGGT